MKKTTIGKLERVPLRKVWEHEAHDFTQWLQENIDVLNTALDLNLVNVDREQASGDFNIDLVAEDENGGTVIIENQLEKSNHDHLGKLITYLAGTAAKSAIWIVADPRPEHVAAVSWLNESCGTAFYMVKVEAVQIENSPAAALFTLIMGPSEATIAIGQTKKGMVERDVVRKRWWTTLIARSAAITKLHSHISPGQYAWIGTSCGIRGLNFNYVVFQEACAVELYIDRGKDGDEENTSIYQQLLGKRVQIDAAFGEPLSWEPLETRRACRLRHTQAGGGYRSPEAEWPAVQDTTIRDMDRLEKALRPYLKGLKRAS